MRSLRTLAIVTAVAAYCLVALSPLVRITGSGLGCGEHWPLCNGHVFPPLNNPHLIIEWSHRLAAASVSVLVAALAVTAWLLRRRSGVAGRGGVLRPAGLALALLVIQVLLGAITVWLTLPPPVVVVHLANAMALLATVCVTALRAGRLAAPLPGSGAAVSLWGRRVAWLIASLAAVTVLLGALTANLGAGPACLGFPLCNGTLWPAHVVGGLAEVHWVHRLAAYTLFLSVIWILVEGRRRGEPRRFQRALGLVAGLLALQVAIAAAMILALFPNALRALHAAVGAGIWVGVVYLVWMAGSPRARATGTSV